MNEQMKKLLARITSVRNYLSAHPLMTIFLLGVILRVIVFLFQCPFNVDNHWGVIQYIYKHHALPATKVLRQAQHPPLYYIMAALFYAGGPKAVQALSLLLSIGTLGIFYWLIKHLEFIQPLRIKKHCLLFASFLPQLVIGGNFISNDSLSFFMGALIFLQTYLYIHQPRLRRQNVLALYLGLGLLTKGIFLFFMPPLIGLVLFMKVRSKRGPREIILSLFIFIFIFLCSGSYKAVSNVIHYGRPLIFNIRTDEGCYVDQGPNYAGPRSFYDVNIFKLLKDPSFPPNIRNSYPLLLYHSFWNQYRTQSEQKIIAELGRCNARATFLLAILPSVLFSIGFFRCLPIIWTLFNRERSPFPPSPNTLYLAACFFLFCSNLLFIFYYTRKFDVWSSIQARYLFPSFLGLILLFHAGLTFVIKKWGILEKPIYYCLTGLYFSFLVYFLTSIIFSCFQCPA